jgi:glutathione S-transferase
MLTLYFAPGASSMAVHIALHEIGVPFDKKMVSLAKKETREPAYLAINPNGKVPTLAVDGRSLIEVAGCLFYLAKRFPEAKLLPANDAETEAQAVAWMSFIASTLHPARAKGPEHANEVWRVADGMLGKRDWALGQFSIVDIHLFRVFWRMSPSLNPPPGTLKNLFAHYDGMMARPSVKRTIEIESKIGYELPA